MTNCQRRNGLETERSIHPKHAVNDNPRARIPKAIYGLNLRLGDGPYVASALGIVGTVLVACCLLAANKLLGKSMGELFKA